MSDDVLVKEKSTPDVQWYEDVIEIRGCHLSLPQIKAAYRELSALNRKEGEQIVNALIKPEGSSDEDWSIRAAFLKDDAFRLTVSVMGFDGETTYGETESIFDSKNLPFPIRTVFFTNTTAFKRNANEIEPRDRFSLWVSFDKPPLFDASAVLSEPTINDSRMEIRSGDVTFFRAIQTIVSNKILSKKKWDSFIHWKFTYDVGLWFVAFPYALYWVTIYCDFLLPPTSPHSSFRIAFYIYGLVLSLIAYRALFGYLKWAFPVNVLEENKDRATRHRLLLGGIVTSLVVSGAKSIFSTVF
ncbi:hypothetical protein [Rhizobium leguminosarum]|uniref:hypothetical protein n=1 Tax=Rhizobium leguminosarum TaxID=384 RepID=UPI0014415A71|nr:hypothetical protein [Rhizobium leguminosarum]MBY5520538.1 hypothetical protein [Rhizobium leguminosarum]NKK99511.1 hypothetical protein [Rhizobium leguminosarum bv. viciae]